MQISPTPGERVLEAERRYHELFSSVDQGFCTIDVPFSSDDRPTDYRFVEVNASFARQMGIEQAAGRWMREIAPDHDEHWFQTYGRVSLTGEPALFEHGSIPLGRWWTVYAFRIDDQPRGRVGILFNDITARKRAEEAQHESEQKLSALVRATSDTVYEMSADWRVMYFLEGRPFIAATDAPRDDWIQEYIPEDEQERVWACIRRAIETKSIFELEHRILAPDRTIGWTSSRAIPVFDECGAIVKWFGTASDITKRKLAEQVLRESEERQRFLLDLSDRLRALTDASQIMNAAAEMFGRHLGLSRVEYLVVSPDADHYDVAASYDDGRLPRVATARGRISDHGPGWGAAFGSGKSVFTDDHDARATSDGGHRSESAVPLLERGRIVAIFSTSHPEPRNWTAAEKMLQHDVADRTRAAVERARAEAAVHHSEAALRVLLNEREELLKELHHRVKNNLQVVTSLLELQARQVDEPQALARLTEASNRVTAIAVIHELLYQSESFSRVDLGNYARRLVPHVVSLHEQKSRISVSVTGAGVTLDLGRAVPFGLLLNELVSNACKHAFSDGSGGELSVTLQQSDGHIHLHVADTGSGMPGKFDERTATTLGIRLVQMLTRQLGGSVAFSTAGGTIVDVRLPADPH